MSRIPAHSETTLGSASIIGWTDEATRLRPGLRPHTDAALERVKNIRVATSGGADGEFE